MYLNIGICIHYTSKYDHQYTTASFVNEKDIDEIQCCLVELKHRVKQALTTEQRVFQEPRIRMKRPTAPSSHLHALHEGESNAKRASSKP